MSKDETDRAGIEPASSDEKDDHDGRRVSPPLCFDLGFYIPAVRERLGSTDVHRMARIDGDCDPGSTPEALTYHHGYLHLDFSSLLSCMHLLHVWHESGDF